MENTAKALVGNEFISIDLSAKAITTIPGWAALWNEKDGADNPVAQALAYKTSVWAFACVNKRANALGSIKWEIRKKVGNEFEVVEGNGAETVLREVNPEMNWVGLIRGTESDLLVYGKAYWLMVRGQNSQNVVALQKLNPENMKVKSTAAGISHFEYTVDGKQPEKLEREDVMYLRTYDPQDDFGGLSPTQVAINAINTLTNSKKYIAAFFKNNAQPRIILTPKGGKIQQGDLEHANSLWQRMFRGVQNQHKTAILGQSYDVHQLDYALKDLALKEVEEAARRDIAAAYEVPPTIVGAWDSANYATAKEEHLSFYTDTVIPRADYIASVINAELIHANFGSEFEFVWLYKDLPIFEVDISAETERVVKLVEMGIIKKEVAAQELGYEVSDVPETIEDLPITEQVEVPPVEPPVEPAKAVISVEPDDEDWFMEDLKKFYTKSKNRLSSGKSAACEFNSEYIPAQLMSAIKAQLEDVETNEELMSIFDDIRNNKEVWGTYP